MINQELNTILKKMWSLKEKIDSGEVLLEADEEYWVEHLQQVKIYYFKNSAMWLAYPDIKSYR